jgi:hypothetical protein
VRDLFRTSERLATYREKYPERYAVELRAWQIRSHIQLIVTRLKLAPNDAQLQEQLRKALLEQVDVRILQLKQERQKTAERLTRLDEQISTMQAQRELVADKQLWALARNGSKRPHPKHRSREMTKEGLKRGSQEKSSGGPKPAKPTPRTKRAKTTNSPPSPK